MGVKKKEDWTLWFTLGEWSMAHTGIVEFICWVPYHCFGDTSAAVNIPCSNPRFTMFLGSCLFTMLFCCLLAVICASFLPEISFLLSPNLIPVLLSWFSPRLHFIFYARPLNFSVVWPCCQPVPSWVLFPRWYVAVCCSGAPLFTSVFLGISTLDVIRSPPSTIGGICPSPYRPSLQFPNSQPEPCYPSAIMDSSYRKMCAALFSRNVSILHTVTRISSPSLVLAATVLRCQHICVW